MKYSIQHYEKKKKLKEENELRKHREKETRKEIKHFTLNKRIYSHWKIG